MPSVRRSIALTQTISFVPILTPKYTVLANPEPKTASMFKVYF